MNERVRKIGKIALAAALIGTVGIAAKNAIEDAPRRVAEREQAIDARCGGTARPNCDRVEFYRPIIGGFFTGPSPIEVVVYFKPKPTSTSMPTELDNEK